MLKKIINKIISFINILALGYLKKETRGKFIYYLKLTIEWLDNTFSFLILLNAYIASRLVSKIGNSRFFPKVLRDLFSPILGSFYKKILAFHRKNELTINRVSLIELALHNMKFKLTRTLITTGGMAIGIAAIVFLVSLGYGLQNLVISRVARLDEMKQAEVFTQPGSNVKINDKQLNSIKDLNNVADALPLIALVGKINYQGSISDMAAYGVTSSYFDNSAIKTVKGNFFDSNEISYRPENLKPTVAGISSERPTSTLSSSAAKGKVNRQVSFNVLSGNWVRIRKEPSKDSEIIGYTKHMESDITGDEVWGGTYDTDATPNPGNSGTNAEGEKFGKWIKADYFIWEKDGNAYKQKTQDTGNVLRQEGYVAEVNLDLPEEVSTSLSDVSSINSGEVLGILAQNLETANTTPSTDDDLDVDNTGNSYTSVAGIEGLAPDDKIWDLIKKELPKTEQEKVESVPLPVNAKKQAVVNRAMLQILGLNENEAVGREFEVSFVVTADLLPNSSNKVESVATNYTIVGVIAQDDVPFFYVPFIDLRGLGISNYSQLKVIAKDTKYLPDLRKQIEALGFSTTSVTDTVDQINNLFRTLRFVLALIGTVALSVAALGMFNTLTVSLLERTREIGLMKAMGMKSNEVRELFLTESMIMGFLGGLFGIALGIGAGKIVEIGFSAFSIAKGSGYLSMTSVPPAFIAIILLLSLIVGTVTGIYPSRRATRISALDALRYE